MGLLDDAIREHLELKRRRGADPEEVTRQENEALGAARRAEFARPEGGEAPAETGGTDAPVPAEPAAAAPFDADAPADHEPAPPRTDPFAPSEPVRKRDEPPERSEPAEPAPPAEPVVEADEPVAEAGEPVEAGDEREPFDIESVEAPAEAPTERQDWLEDERDEVPADEALDHPRSAEADEGEDVLEETPDFLQETPEHERLWFEQRPPRDFDWDK
jgi:hypothetical protein